MLIIDYFTMMMVMMTIIANFFLKKEIHGWVGLGKITTALAMIE